MEIWAQPSDKEIVKLLNFKNKLSSFNYQTLQTSWRSKKYKTYNKM